MNNVKGFNSAPSKRMTSNVGTVSEPRGGEKLEGLEDIELERES